MNNGQIVNKGEISELYDTGLMKEFILEEKISENSGCAYNSSQEVSPITIKETSKTVSQDMEVIEIGECNNNKLRILVREEGK